jgi:hypothetical protein
LIGALFLFQGLGILIGALFLFQGLGILIGALFLFQGLGILIGALFMDFQRSLVAAAVIMLTLMLLGGYYIERLPPWLQWAQYVSFVSYNFRSMLEFAFLDLNLRYLSYTNNNLLCALHTILIVS